MAKPTKHGDKWRIRWLDEHGKRQSAVFDDYKRAQTELSRQQVEVEEIRRGVRKPRVALFGTDYQWLRSDDEIRRFLAAARVEDEHVFVFYAVAIFTGMRAGEIAALEWPDVDFERRLLAVQRSFNGPTKSDRVRYVPILDPLLPLLRAWRLNGFASARPWQAAAAVQPNNVSRAGGRT